MGVVVDDQRAGGRPPELLEAAAGAAKPSQRRGGPSRIGARQPARRRAPRPRCGRCARRAPGGEPPRPRRRTASLRTRGSSSCSSERVRPLRRQALEPGATTRSLGAREELDECVLERGQRAVGDVMVEVDVGEHGDVDVEREHRAIRLVRLDDQPLPRPPGGVGAGAAHLAADQITRVKAALQQRVRHHRGCRRLAVRPGDRDDATQARAAHRAGLPRERSGNPRRRASARSGLSSGIAVEWTTSTSSPAGTLAASWPIATSIPAARTRPGRPTAPHRSPSPWRRARAPPAHRRSCRRRRCPTTCRRRPFQVPRAAHVRLPPQHLARRPRGPRPAARGSPRRSPSPPAASGPPAGPRPRAQPRGGQLVVGHDDRRAAVDHPAGVGRLVVGGRVRIGHEQRGPAVGRDLEDRTARARDHQVSTPPARCANGSMYGRRS